MIRRLLSLLVALLRPPYNLIARHSRWVWIQLDEHVAPPVVTIASSTFGWVERRRRWIPPLFGAAVCLSLIVPVYAGWMEEREANLWTLLLASIGFAMKSYLFFAMRRRMLNRRSSDGEIVPHTIFGTALIDWFGALFLVAFDLFAIFALSYYFARTGSTTTPPDVAIFNRAFLNGSVAYVIATSVAVFYEMQRAGSDLRIHDDSWQGNNRRRRPYGRRATDLPPVG